MNSTFLQIFTNYCIPPCVKNPEHISPHVTTPCRQKQSVVFFSRPNRMILWMRSPPSGPRFLWLRQIPISWEKSWYPTSNGTHEIDPTTSRDPHSFLLVPVGSILVPLVFFLADILPRQSPLVFDVMMMTLRSTSLFIISENWDRPPNFR